MLEPAVSIIIPCRNEIDFIDQCLTSVFEFQVPVGDFEVIVVDGLSCDGTREKLGTWCKEHRHLRVLDNPRKIVPTAMNIGISAARGRWIVRLDAHSAYPTDYLRCCIETAERSGADNVGGVIISSPREDSMQTRLVQAITSHRFGVGDAGFRVGAPEGPADTVPFGCYRREALDRIGPYDERLVRSQDYELNRRLLKAGGRIWTNPAIRVHYYGRNSLRGLMHQATSTGKWNPWCWYVAPYAFVWRHAVPAVFVLSLFTALVLGLLITGGWVSFTGIILPYMVLAISASVQQSRHYGWWMLPLLPFLFLSYHLSYGIGILWGILLLSLGRSPVQQMTEPWIGAGRYRAWPPLDWVRKGS